MIKEFQKTKIRNRKDILTDGEVEAEESYSG